MEHKGTVRPETDRLILRPFSLEQPGNCVCRYIRPSERRLGENRQ